MRHLIAQKIKIKNPEAKSYLLPSTGLTLDMLCLERKQIKKKTKPQKLQMEANGFEAKVTAHI